MIDIYIKKKRTLSFRLSILYTVENMHKKSTPLNYAKATYQMQREKCCSFPLRNKMYTLDCFHGPKYFEREFRKWDSWSYGKK